MVGGLFLQGDGAQVFEAFAEDKLDHFLFGLFCGQVLGRDRVVDLPLVFHQQKFHLSLLLEEVLGVNLAHILDEVVECFAQFVLNL